MVALRDTHFMVLSKESYQKIIGQERQKMNQKHLELIKNTYYFSDISRKVVQFFNSNKTIETYNFGRIIQDWGQPVTRLSIVLDGQVTLIRKRNKVIKDVDEMLAIIGNRNFTSEELLKNELLSDDMKARIPEIIALFQNLTTDGADQGSRHPLLSKKYKQLFRVEDLCIRSPGQTFGEEFLVHGKPCEYRVVVSSHSATIMSLSEENVHVKMFSQMSKHKEEFIKTIDERAAIGFPWKVNIVPILEKELNDERISKEIASGKSISLQRKERQDSFLRRALLK